MSKSYPALRVTKADGSSSITSPSNLKSLVANAKTFMSDVIAKIESGTATASEVENADSKSTIEKFSADEVVFTNQKLNKMLLNKDAVNLARIKQAELEVSQAEADAAKSEAADATAKAAAAQTELDEMKKILEQVQNEKAELEKKAADAAKSEAGKKGTDKK